MSKKYIVNGVLHLNISTYIVCDGEADIDNAFSDMCTKIEEFLNSGNVVLLETLQEIWVDEVNDIEMFEFLEIDENGKPVDEEIPGDSKAQEENEPQTEKELTKWLTRQ